MYYNSFSHYQFPYRQQYISTPHFKCFPNGVCCLPHGICFKMGPGSSHPTPTIPTSPAIPSPGGVTVSLPSGLGGTSLPTLPGQHVIPPPGGFLIPKKLPSQVCASGQMCCTKVCNDPDCKTWQWCCCSCC